MKRRALLLLGALLMPSVVHAKTVRKTVKQAKPAPHKVVTHKAPAKAPVKAPVKTPVKAPAKPAAKPAPAKSAPQPAKPAGLQPLKEARTQLIAFNTSAFPYRGAIPGSNKPFLDVRQGKRLGHTSLRGDVYWEDQTYSDRRSLLYLPEGYNPALPSLMVIYLHGQGATLERDVIARQGIARQVSEAGQNVALVAPQLAYDALDSSAGNFWKPGHFAAYIDEAAERLMRLYGDKRAGPHFNAAQVLLVAYSGGYLSAAYALARGGATYRVKGVVLMDSLYGDEDKFAAWATTRRQTGFLLSAFTDSTREENGNLQAMLAKRRIAHAGAMPRTLAPGTMTFIACGGLDMHGDFMTRAWGQDPLAQTLALIPGYPQKPPVAKGKA